MFLGVGMGVCAMDFLEEESDRCGNRNVDNNGIFWRMGMMVRGNGILRYIRVSVG